GVGDTAERNLISGSTYQGVLIGDVGTSGNVVAGNYIGTDAAGTTSLANANGVYLYNGATDNRVGTDGLGPNAAAKGNVIAGNTYNGVIVADAGTSGNMVAGNRIGTGAAGNPLQNHFDGVIVLNGANGNT